MNRPRKPGSPKGSQILGAAKMDLPDDGSFARRMMANPGYVAQIIAARAHIVAWSKTNPDKKPLISFNWPEEAFVAGLDLEIAVKEGLITADASGKELIDHLNKVFPDSNMLTPMMFRVAMDLVNVEPNV